MYEFSFDILWVGFCTIEVCSEWLEVVSSGTQVLVLELGNGNMKSQLIFANLSLAKIKFTKNLISSAHTCHILREFYFAKSLQTFPGI